jgi:hypothetical protein
MSANEIFADAAGFDRDLALLEHLRRARKEFVDRLCEASENREEACWRRRPGGGLAGLGYEVARLSQ